MADLQINDTWFLAQGEREGRPLLIRARQNLLGRGVLASHPHLLVIRWLFKPDNMVGMPSNSDTRLMERFENIIVGELERDWLCIFFCINTCNGIKEWRCYSSDLSETKSRINAALSGHVEYPITMTAEDDPEWHELSKVLEGSGMLP